MTEADISKTYTPQVEVKELNPSHHYYKSLSLGYEIRAVADLEEDGIVYIGSRYQLLKDGMCIHEFDAGQATERRDTDTCVFSSLEPFLVEALGDKAVSWMRGRFLKEPAVIPPWEREEPIRSIKVNAPLEKSHPYYRDNLNAEANRASDSLTDVGNAERFKQEADGWLIYDRSSKEWFAWNVNHWEEAEERIGKTELFIAETLKQERAEWERVYAAVNDTEDKTSKKISNLLERYTGHYHSTAKNCNLKSMADICSRSTMSVDLRKERNPHILAFRNGAVNTRTGEMMQLWECDKLRLEYSTVYMDCEYVEEDSEIWKDHLDKVFTDNTTPELTDDEREKRRKEATEYFMRLLGYSLYSGNPEQIMGFLWGEGLNGKSVTVDVLKRIWGVEKLDVTCRELFTSNDDRPRSGIAKALQKRVLLLTEAGKSDTGRKDAGLFSSSTIKILTGETQTSEFREMYKDSEKDVPISCFPLATTNALPRFDNTDAALLRRIVTIPFQHKFTDEERDLNITEKLGRETDKIFSMMIRELQKYLTDGLKPTPIHFKATRVELLVGAQRTAFLKQTYEPSQNTGLKGTELQTAYLDWCSLNGYDVDTKSGVEREPMNGGKITVAKLTKEEVSKLYLGARELYGSFKSHGIERFKCELRG